MHKQLYKYFKDTNLLAEQQYGFRPKRSTELTAIKLIDYVLRELDNRINPRSIKSF